LGFLQVMAARHLPNPDHIISPFVQVKLWPYTGGQADDYSFKTTLFSKETGGELGREELQFRL